jgi:hypothetical protein
VALWPELGWKNIGLGQLITFQQVKISYIKAVAKVHPDKVNDIFYFYSLPKPQLVSKRWSAHMSLRHSKKDSKLLRQPILTSMAV